MYEKKRRAKEEKRIPAKRQHILQKRTLKSRSEERRVGKEKNKTPPPQIGGGISLAEGASASVAAADSISTAAQEKQYDQDTAVVAAKTVSTADSISIATAAKQKDDPENGIASIIVVCVSTSIVFASASTVCSCYITHVFIPPELIYTS